nr:zinc finger, CCHC-type [Tanacetum cinerariifolium]
MTNADKTTALKMDVYKKAQSALLLCLDNKVLREVNKDDSAARVWLKLETLYMTKSLASKLYLKKKLFTFYMHSGKKLSEHIDEFNKLISDLANIDIDIDDEDQALMLLTINSRELKKRTDAKDDGDELYVRGRSDHRGNQGHGSSRSKMKGYDNGDLLMAVSEERFLEWIMDSGGSFYITPKRDFLFDFKEFNGGTVLLVDNRACAIMGIVKGNYVYSLDGWAESGEAIVGIQEKESLAQVWQKRLGHISKAGFHELEKREVLRNKGLGKLEFCKHCVLGKSTRGSFDRGHHTTEGVIDYVHADLWCPSQVELMSGCRYFLSIVDDYLRRVWVHFLRHKNEAFNKFKEWK